MSFNYGYMGFGQPTQTTWFDGRSVIVYPDGTVKESDSGQIIRKGSAVQESIIVPPTTTSGNNQQLIILALVAIVAIVALMRR